MIIWGFYSVEFVDGAICRRRRFVRWSSNITTNARLDHLPDPLPPLDLKQGVWRLQQRTHTRSTHGNELLCDFLIGCPQNQFASVEPG